MSAEWVWTRARERAALLTAEDALTDVEIAAEVGISERTLNRWRKRPEFVARVEEHIEAFRAVIARKAIAQRGRRVAALQDRWRRMQRVIEERAADPGMADVPGGRTGLIVRRVKGIGRGEDFERVEEYAVDDGLLREMREHERQAAQELGQWLERSEVRMDDRAGERLAQKLEELAARLGGVVSDTAAGAEENVSGEPDTG